MPEYEITVTIECKNTGNSITRRHRKEIESGAKEFEIVRDLFWDVEKLMTEQLKRMNESYKPVWIPIYRKSV